MYGLCEEQIGMVRALSAFPFTLRDIRSALEENRWNSEAAVEALLHTPVSFCLLSVVSMWGPHTKPSTGGKWNV